MRLITQQTDREGGGQGEQRRGKERKKEGETEPTGGPSLPWLRVHAVGEREKAAAETAWSDSRGVSAFLSGRERVFVCLLVGGRERLILL